MTDLSDFKRRVHDPAMAHMALLRQDVAGCEAVFDSLGVPKYTKDGDKLRPTGRAQWLRYEVARLRTAAGSPDRPPPDTQPEMAAPGETSGAPEGGQNRG